jgi:hypothetical protein
LGAVFPSNHDATGNSVGWGLLPGCLKDGREEEEEEGGEEEGEGRVLEG